MAGKQIYTGKMLESMEAKIASLQADMGTMSGDMASMVSELITFKTSIGQGVDKVNIKPGTNNEIVLNSSALTSNSTTFVNVIVLSFFCDGQFSLKGSFHTVSGTAGTYLAYSINAGADVQLVLATSPTPIPFDESIQVAAGDVMYIKIRAGNASYTAQLDAGTIAGYDIVDIVNDSAIIIA